MIGATLNKLGLIKFEATKVGKETALAQIIRLVEEAQGSQGAHPEAGRPDFGDSSSRR